MTRWPSSRLYVLRLRTPSSKQTGDNSIRHRFAAWRSAPPEIEEIRRCFEARQREGQAARIQRWQASGFSADEIANLIEISAAEIRRVLRECCGMDRHQAGAARASQPDLVALKRFERELLPGGEFVTPIPWTVSHEEQIGEGDPRSAGTSESVD